MEASQFLQRCLRHSLLRSPHCKNSRPLRSASFPTRRKQILSSPRKSWFSTSRRIEKDNAEENTATKSRTVSSPASTANKPQATRPAPTTTGPRLDILNLLDNSGSASGLDTFGPSKRRTAFVDETYTTMMAGRPKTAISTKPVEQLSIYNRITEEQVDDHVVPLRLKPTLGRTVNLTTHANMDLTRAFRLLEVRCAQNKVRTESNLQRTYVRRGQRKKIEKRRRWRALFQAGFMEECKRVRRMRAQGW